MTTQKNPYLIENKKPVEIVYELKNQVPSYEDFIRNYKNNEKISKNYELEIDVYEKKGYGPCPDGCSSGDFSKKEQHLISTLNKRWGEEKKLWDEEGSAYDKDGFQ